MIFCVDGGRVSDTDPDDKPRKYCPELAARLRQISEDVRNREFEFWWEYDRQQRQKR